MTELFKLAGIITIEGLEAVQKGLKDLEKNTKNAIKPLVKFGRQAQATGKVLTKNITVPLAALGAATTKFAADFQKAMTTSLAIMGAEGEKFRGQMEETAKQISTQSTFSAAELAKSYYYLASAGLSAEQSIAALGKVAKFAEAGQFDLQIATDLLTDAQSALGLVTEDVVKNEQNMVRVSDALVKANTLANASVQQFSEALTNRAGAALRILGKDVEEGVAVLAAFADQGVKGAEAGTQLGIVLRDLQKANERSKEEFEKAGIAVYDTAGEMRNLADVIGDIENALKGKSDEEKRAQLSILGFQERSLASLLTLIGTSEQIRKYETELRSAAGTTEEVAKKQIQNFSDQMKILLNRLQVVAIELGNNLLPILQNDIVPVLEKIIKLIGSIAQWFGSWDDSIKKIVISLTAFVAVIGPALLIIGKLALATKTLVAAITALKLGVVGLSAALSIGAAPLVAIVAGVTGLAAILLKLTERQRKSAKLQKKMNEEMEAGTENSKNLREAWEKEADELAKLNEKREKELLFREKLSALMDDPNFRGLPEAERRRKAQELKDSLDEVNYSSQSAQSQLEMSRQKYEQETKAKEENIVVNKKIKRSLEEIEADQETINQLVSERMKKIDNLKRKEEEQINRRRENTKKLLEWEKQVSEAATKNVLDNYREFMEEKQRLDEIDRKNIEKATNARIDSMNTIAGYVNDVAGLINGLYENEAISIDNNYKRRKKAIENTEQSEEEKKNALIKLDEEYDKKRSALAKKQAIADKAQAIFNIGINTAVAITKVLATSANLIVAGIIGAIGAAQAAIVAARPIPEMAEGGIIKSKSGGTLVNAGEAGEDEGFIPMKKGTASIADAIISAMRRYPGIGTDTTGAGTIGARGNNISLHIGTLIADDKGLSELERRLKVFRISENNRLGVV